MPEPIPARMDNGEVRVGVYWQNYSDQRRGVEWWVRDIGVNWLCYNDAIEFHQQDWPRFHALSKRLNGDGLWHRTSRYPAYLLHGLKDKPRIELRAFDQECRPFLHGWFARDEWEDKFPGEFKDNAARDAAEIVRNLNEWRAWMDLPIHYNFNGGNISDKDKPDEIAAQKRITDQCESVSCDIWHGTAAIKRNPDGSHRLRFERRFEATDLLTQRSGKLAIGYVDTADQQLVPWPMNPGETWESRAPTEDEVRTQLTRYRRNGVIFFAKGKAGTNATPDNIANVLKAMVPAIKRPDGATDEQVAKLTKEITELRRAAATLSDDNTRLRGLVRDMKDKGNEIRIMGETA